VLDEVAVVVADGHDVIEVVFVVVLDVEFVAFQGAGEDGVQCSFAGVGLEVVLDGGLAGLVFVFALLGVVPPEEDFFAGALFADDSSAQGIVAIFDVAVAGAVGFYDAVV